MELTDCEARNAQNPTTFEIPSKEDIGKLTIDDWVKLIFNDEERMWVKILGIAINGFIGELGNEPIIGSELKFGDAIVFEFKHIALIEFSKYSKYRFPEHDKD